MVFWSALAQNGQENTSTTSHSNSASESATDTEGGGETSTTEPSKAAASDDASATHISEDTTSGSDACRLLTREELIQHLLSISPVPQGQVTTVGMVKKNVCNFLISLLFYTMHVCVGGLPECW